MPRTQVGRSFVHSTAALRSGIVGRRKDATGRCVTRANTCGRMSTRPRAEYTTFRIIQSLRHRDSAQGALGTSAIVAPRGRDERGRLEAPVVASRGRARQRRTRVSDPGRCAARRVTRYGARSGPMKLVEPCSQQEEMKGIVQMRSAVAMATVALGCSASGRPRAMGVLDGVGGRP